MIFEIFTLKMEFLGPMYLWTIRGPEGVLSPYYLTSGIKETS